MSPDHRNVAAPVANERPNKVVTPNSQTLATQDRGGEKATASASASASVSVSCQALVRASTYPNESINNLATQALEDPLETYSALLARREQQILELMSQTKEPGVLESNLDDNSAGRLDFERR